MVRQNRNVKAPGSAWQALYHNYKRLMASHVKFYAIQNYKIKHLDFMNNKNRLINVTFSKVTWIHRPHMIHVGSINSSYVGRFFQEIAKSKLWEK